MIILNIVCVNNAERDEIRDEFCEALVGSPAFINSEIMVSDDPKKDNVFSLILGENNGRNIEYNIDSSDFFLNESSE